MGDKSPDVTLLQVCRSADDAIFGRELREIAMQWPSLKLLTHYTQDGGRPTAATIEALVPDFEQHHAMLCGPAGFIAMVQQLWRQHGALDRLQIEYFGAAATVRQDGPVEALRIDCTKSERSFDSSGQVLLQEAEHAGLRPKHGCRIGICRSCQCRKLSGTTANLLTGEIDSTPNQLIQLCITSARSDLQLDL
jgi:ferredoxin